MIKFAGVFCALLLIAPLKAPLAHNFPERSQPAAGATFTYTPKQVRIWFDGSLEPLFSTLKVQNASGQSVDKGDATVNARNDSLLEVSLPSALPSGVYRVLWSVAARDGHRTEGDYTFRLAGR